MNLHKLSAGSGYTYLTKQVARSDLTATNGQTLADYYSEKGEQPGRWAGQGLVGLAGPHGVAAGEVVTEEQMKALFGEGLHPGADAIITAATAAGASGEDAVRAARLGTPFTDLDTPATPFIQGVTRAYNRWLSEHHLTRNDPIPDEVREQIRTRVGREMFTAQHDRAPLNARELSAHIARQSRPAKTTVAGYDMTFTASKSVSLLWVAAEPGERARIKTVFDEAVSEALAFVEAEGVYTRRGKGGIRQVKTTGLVAGVFDHRDNRDGDPHLHAHVAVSNKVQDPVDGKWLALDGQVVYKLNVVASERFNRVLRTKMRTLGYTWQIRPGTGIDGKEPVWEIGGIPAPLIAAMSSRDAAITAKMGELAAEFTDRNGRPPTVKEAHKLHRIAHEATRADKAEPRSFNDQLAQWLPRIDRELAAIPGAPDTHQGLVAHAQQVGSADQQRPLRERVTGRDELSPAQVHDLAAAVVATVSAKRAVFDEGHLRSKIEAGLEGYGLSEGAGNHAVEQVLAAATGTDLSVRLDAHRLVAEPAELTQNGRSVYDRAFGTLFTTTAVLDAEQVLLDAAQATGGRVLEASMVEMALLEHAANNDFALNTGQAQLVRDMTTSGRALQLALAPAGTGKTTAMACLTRAWQDSGGTIIGLAPSAAAAKILGVSMGTDADTLAKLTWHIHGGPGQPPAWMSGIDASTMVVIDEAGMASTTQLAAAVTWLTSRGAQVRLIGDDQQLAAPAAGGALRTIASDVGALTLSEVVRFTTPGEAAATLAWRAGDVEALGFYLDRGRVTVASPTTITDTVFNRWSQCRARGQDALMIAQANTTVTDLNGRARAARLSQRAAGGGQVGPTVVLRSGLEASAGDIVVTRKNKRKLRLGRADFVKNGDRWDVIDVRDGGALVVQHREMQRRVVLPADYVSTQVDLGYATTGHGAQGQTVDIGLTLFTGTEDRQWSYVAITRGRDHNELFVPVGSDGDEHHLLHPDHVVPPTAVEFLETTIRRDGAAVSATTTLREQHDPARLLASSAMEYDDALGHAATTVIGADRMAQLTAHAEQVVPGVSAAPAWETLAGHLATIELDGGNPAAALTHAASTRALTGAKDVAAVLDWRLDATGRHSATPGPLPWLPGVPTTLADHPTYGPWLTARAELVTNDAAAVRTRAAASEADTAPAWAHPFLDVADLHADLALWRAAFAIPDQDASPTGPPRLSLRERHYQDRLTGRAQKVLHAGGHAPGQAFVDQLRHLAPAVLADPWWPTLAGRLDQAQTAGRDVAALIDDALSADPGHIAARTAANMVTGPLPDEHPAAALWSRLLPSLAATTALDVQARPGAGRLMPSWAPALADALPGALPRRVMADPAWPWLVAVVDDVARRLQLPPEQVITAAAALIPREDLPRPRQHAAHRIGLHELTHVLIWRVEDLVTSAQPGPGTTPDPALVAEGDFYDAECEAFATQLAAEADQASAAAATPAVSDGTDVDDPDVDDPDVTADTTAADAASAEPAQQDDAPVIAPHGQDAATPAAQPPTADSAPSSSPGPAPDPSPTGAAGESTSAARIIELNTAAAAFYAAHYPGSPAQEHITARFGTDLTHTPFTVGYAPPVDGKVWTTRHLTAHLRHTEDATNTELVDAGLARWTRDRDVYDVFRDRVMIAIHDHKGQVIGFNGRDLTGDPDVARYLNTPTTAAFTKGHMLFGAYEGRAMAQQAGAQHAPGIVRVEGPMDAIAITLAGNTTMIGVSTGGTALSATQTEYLADLARAGKVWLALDRDDAGRAATTDSYWQLLDRGVDPRTIPLAGGKDPAAVFTADKDTLAAFLAMADLQPSAAVEVCAGISTDFQLHARDQGVAWTVLAAQRMGTVLAALPVDQWDQAIAAAAYEFPHPDSPEQRGHMEEILWHTTIAAAVHWTPDVADRTPTTSEAAAMRQVLADLTATVDQSRTYNRHRDRALRQAAERLPQEPATPPPASDRHEHRTTPTAPRPGPRQ